MARDACRRPRVPHRECTEWKADWAWIPPRKGALRDSPATLAHPRRGGQYGIVRCYAPPATQSAKFTVSSEEASDGPVRRLHRRREHGQSHGRQRAQGGIPMLVFDLSPKAMENLIQGGARRARSAQEVVEGSEIVLTSLPASPDVEAMYLESGGLVERAKPGTILVDLSSVLPSTPRKIEPKAKARGVHFLESPVSGGVTGARAATLALMVGGDAAVLERARPVLLSMGPNVFHVGPVGAGNIIKAINNMMACVNGLAMMEGLAVGVKAGLDPMTVYEVVKASSGGSKALERIPCAIVPREFDPGFKVSLMNKDLETFTTVAKELHVPVSFVNVAQRYEQMALAAGLGEQDTTVVMTVIERLAAIQTPRGEAGKTAR